jgi:hypothetical protein
MAFHLRGLAFIALFVLAAVGCKKEKAPVPSDRYDEVGNPVGDTRVRPFAAVTAPFPAELTQKITAERCAREIRCTNVGPGKKFADLNACMAALGAKSKAELDAYGCSAGVDGNEVDKCLAEIRGADCSAAQGALERLGACAAGLLCSAK